MDSPTNPGRSGMGTPRPLFLDTDMGAIHKAASVGNVRKVKKILLFRKSGLNDRDRMSRTALHVACCKGHPRVVRLLTRRHCLLNLCDIDNKTALIHAIQYDQEECATILLDHGANPNVMDIHGNTPLHYAVLGHNTAIVEKLLSCMANMEARNKDDFTPLSLAKYENREKMVEFLVTRASKINHMESEQQLPSKYKEERPIRSSDGSNLAADLQESPKQALSKTKSKTESRCMKLVQWIRRPPFWRLPRPPPATTAASASATAATASSGRSSGSYDLCLVV
ncbi:ankyrin repeat domain-containing protein 26-like [Myotis lucifugus]|uniref:ankyrin repeat domain-containing protein 26-like n=1 Tax=Myotis lucifugus TaxID=59463 RepID=UPI000CCC8A90|nr:ankyrin repeat domain-containing protein 26-like [Myotis lucifugus]